ncbi:MAG: hypothetical protein WBY53_18250 [Acidobacteriaceae bacterium]
MSDAPKCFVAYTSQIPGGGDAIEHAIELLNASDQVTVKGWKSLSIGGSLIIDTICNEIRQCDLFIADVTTLNANVLFELGFAIALGKRIWPLFDPAVAGARADFDQFQMFTTIGYAKFSNSNDIVNKFYTDNPQNSEREPLFDQLMKTAPTVNSDPVLLYIKPELITEAVTRVTRRITASPLPYLIDDPEEIRVQSPSWYAQHVSDAYAVLCHFLSEDHAASKISNAKSAFVAGLAYGLDKPLLMMAHKPYTSPIDYRDLLRVHKDATMAVSFFEQWAKPLVETYETDKENRAAYHVLRAKKARLLDLYLGEPVAEHEANRLEDYFVPTAAYNEAMRSNYSIFVGRKGTGKTATLYKIAADISSDPRNHVCILKPADYELAGVANMLRKESSRSDKGYLVDSFWKLLVYTELAKSVYEKVSARPPFYSKSAGEQKLLEFIEVNERLILPEFSTRLETAIGRLEGIDSVSEEKRKEKISEQLHSAMLGNLRHLLGDALSDCNLVAILADNLDKSWTSSADLLLVSELLLGLLSVGSRISEEFQRSASGRKPMHIRMVIFIRTDMFSVISQLAREKDKIPARKIIWSDAELLMRVIDERFLNVDRQVTPEQTWSKYFTRTVGQEDIKDFILRNIFPRPRDLIVLMKAMIDTAVDRGHDKVNEKDVRTAIEKYSGFAFSTLVVEGVPRFHKFEDIVMELMGGPAIIMDSRLRALVNEADRNYSPEDFIKFLGELSFIGYEVEDNSFEFIYDSSEQARVLNKANRLAPNKAKRRYKIHNALHAFLELTTAAPEQLRMPLQANTDGEEID